MAFLCDLKMEEDITTTSYESKKDKVHLIRVPKGFDISKLHGVDYNPNQVTQIEAHQSKNGLFSVYELGPFDRESLDLKMLMKSGDKVIAGASLQQTLCVNKTVKSENNSGSSSANHSQLSINGKVSFPEGLKQRFVPFGAGSPVVCKNKKSKKKKSKRKRSHDVDAPTPTKKRYKHSSSD